MELSLDNLKINTEHSCFQLNSDAIENPSKQEIPDLPRIDLEAVPVAKTVDAKIVGRTGFIGMCGTTGIHGFTGTCGYAGLIGYTGYEGYTGTSDGNSGIYRDDDIDHFHRYEKVIESGGIIVRTRVGRMQPEFPTVPRGRVVRC